MHAQNTKSSVIQWIENDLLARYILVALWSQEPLPIMELEDSIPASFATTEELKKKLVKLEEKKLLYSYSSPYRTNGATLYALTPGGHGIARDINKRERENGFPVVQRILAHIMIDRWPSISKEFTVEEVEEILLTQGEAFSRHVREGLSESRSR